MPPVTKRLAQSQDDFDAAAFITMNSRAELLDLDTKERMEFTLVRPSHADIENGKISVGAPLGVTMRVIGRATNSNGPFPTVCVA